MENEYNTGCIIMPGDIISPKQCRESKKKIIIGPGLQQFSENLIATKCGVLRQKEMPSFTWIDSHQKRYVPTKGDDVLGIITNKHPELYRVDIGSSEPASLSCYAFEGATKKNKPNLQIGDLVYAKVIVANKDVEPELVCINSQGKKNGLGPLAEGGFMFTVSLNLIRRILSPSCPLLEMLGSSIPFEIAAGMNGRIWIRTKTVRETIALVNAIRLSEDKSDDEIKTLYDKVQNFITGF